MTLNSQTTISMQLPPSLLMTIPDESSLECALNGLTAQQMQVALMLSQGHSNKAIAHEFTRSQATVKAHESAILRQLGCTNRTQAALLIFQWLSGKSDQLPQNARP